MISLPQNIVFLAVKEAEKNDDCRYKHGAVIFNKKKVISVGHNKHQQIPHLLKYGYKNQSLHAEAAAIIKGNVQNSELLVIRKSKTKLSNSKPCPACMSLIIEKGIKKVHYSTVTGEINTIRIS